MELRILCKHLVADELKGKFTAGENNADIVGITLPRFYEKHDLSQFSFRITAAGKCKNAAVQILETDSFDENSVHLLWNVTSDFTSILDEFTLVLTGVNTDNSVTIKFKSCPISVNLDKSWEFMPSPELSEQLLNQAHNEVQKAIDAAERAEKASQTPAPAEIYPATVERLGGIKSGGDISVSGDGVVTVPGCETFKNEISELKSIIGFTGSDIIGLHADFENNIFTRLAGAVGKNAGFDFDIFPMYGNRRRCNVLDNGTITAYYGDSNFAEDGSNGQVMVYQPKFYYRVVPLKLDLQTDGHGYHLRSANYYISAVPKNGFKLHPAFYGEDGEPVDYILFSAYEGSIFDTSANAYLQNDEQIADFSADKLSSVAGVKPCSGKKQMLTRENAELLAVNRGAGWHIDSIKIISLNQMLMFIEYAEFNLQKAIGKGVVNIDIEDNSTSVVTGLTSFYGKSSGMAEGENGKVSISYRGIENPWGNIWKFVNGLNIYGNGLHNGGIPYICSDYNFINNSHSGNYCNAGFEVSGSNGYISAFGYSPKYSWLFLPSETLGNSDQPIGDYCWTVSNLNGNRLPIYGGYWCDSNLTGSFYLSFIYDSTLSAASIGCRLMYIPMSGKI
ncbi:MAG: hypothetical protein NC452_11775 [Eubacterium sp.]|nr:hypothetical protein [Eubacterium sp.]